MENKSRVIIRRISQWLDRHEVYKFFVDGAEVGSIGNASPLYFIIAPGIHKFQCKIKQFSSPELELNIMPDETIYLRTRKRHSLYLVAFFYGIILLVSFLVFKIFGRSSGWMIIFYIAWFSFYIIYSLYIFTIGRKKYLALEEDKKNILAK
jgi:hypothetical protein